MNWPAIESAPRDGSLVWGYSGVPMRDPVIFLMRWTGEGWTRQVHEHAWVTVEPKNWHAYGNPGQVVEYPAEWYRNSRAAALDDMYVRSVMEILRDLFNRSYARLLGSL